MKHPRPSVEQSRKSFCIATESVNEYWNSVLGYLHLLWKGMTTGFYLAQIEQEVQVSMCEINISMLEGVH